MEKHALGQQDTFTTLRDTLMACNVCFAPDMTSGVSCEMSGQGMAKLQCRGTLHRQEALVGVFEQEFGLVVCPEGSWKVAVLKSNFRQHAASVWPVIDFVCEYCFGGISTCKWSSSVAGVEPSVWVLNLYCPAITAVFANDRGGQQLGSTMLGHLKVQNVWLLIFCEPEPVSHCCCDGLISCDNAVQSWIWNGKLDTNGFGGTG